MSPNTTLSSGRYLASLTLFVSAAVTVHGAQYYIDFSSGSDTNSGLSKSTPWKRAPGMTGFAATYAHAAGDQFILKGGVTWDSTTFNWTITKSGTAGNVDYYGVDKTWYSGSTWSQPILDGGGVVAVLGSSSGNLYVNGASYVTIDNLKIQNLGQAYIYNGGRAVYFNNGHDITIQNCTLAPNVRIGVLINDSIGNKTISNFTVQSNDISAVSWGVGVSPSANGAVMSNVVIASNAIHDFSSQMCGGAHGDGIILYPGGGYAGYISTVFIYGNRFYGDFHTDPNRPSCVNNSTLPSVACSASQPCGMNALLYITQPMNMTASIYNNWAAYTNALGYNATATLQPMSAVIQIRPDPGYSNSFSIYNNSFYVDKYVSHGLAFSNATSTAFMNNIIVGTESPLLPIDIISCAGFRADYNEYYNFSGTLAAFPSACGGFQTWNQYHTTHGNEPHGINADPLFVSPADVNLQSGSPAFKAGTNLYSLFTTDAAGKARPALGAWDLGAYQIRQHPAPPSSLKVRVAP
jgi:hypothetical protein